MAIEKKSLISTLKTTKKANVAKEDLSHAGAISGSVKSPAMVVAGKKNIAGTKMNVAGKKHVASVKL